MTGDRLNSVGLYIRQRNSNELWQLFIGSARTTKPSALYHSYLTYFKELHSDYEWVVLERRFIPNKGRRMAMYKIGSACRVDVMPEEPDDGDDFVRDNRRYAKRDVECLALWHMDTDNRTFRGSISNRICPDCTGKEHDWLIGKERDYG